MRCPVVFIPTDHQSARGDRTRVEGGKGYPVFRRGAAGTTVSTLEVGSIAGGGLVMAFGMVWAAYVCLTRQQDTVDTCSQVEIVFIESPISRDIAHETRCTIQ